MACISLPSRRVQRANCVIIAKVCESICANTRWIARGAYPPVYSSYVRAENRSPSLSLSSGRSAHMYGENDTRARSTGSTELHERGTKTRTLTSPRRARQMSSSPRPARRSVPVIESITLTINDHCGAGNRLA